MNKTVIIPVTKSLSLDVEGIIGNLVIDEKVADQLATAIASGLEFKLEAGVVLDAGKCYLQVVSFSGISIKPNI